MQRSMLSESEIQKLETQISGGNNNCKP
jgi:hypothetical protein